MLGFLISLGQPLLRMHHQKYKRHLSFQNNSEQLLYTINLSRRQFKLLESAIENLFTQFLELDNLYKNEAVKIYKNLLEKFEEFCHLPVYCQKFSEKINFLVKECFQNDQTKITFSCYKELEHVLNFTLSSEQDISSLKVAFFTNISENLEELCFCGEAEYYTKQALELTLDIVKKRLCKEKYGEAHDRFTVLWENLDSSSSITESNMIDLLAIAHILTKYYCQTKSEELQENIYLLILEKFQLFKKFPIVIQIDFYYQAGNILLNTFNKLIPIYHKV
jgi:hypothetical protein